MKYLKEFANHNGYTAYTADTQNFVKPNVSYCVQENECHMTPNKKESTLDIACDDCTYGDDAIIEFAVSSGATGQIEFILNGDTYCVGLDNQARAIYKYTPPKADFYTVEARYLGDIRYLPSDWEAVEFEVAKVQPVMSLSGNYENDDLVSGDTLIVYAHLPNDASGIVRFWFNGEEWERNVVNGVATFTYSGVTADGYLIDAEYEGDVNYESCSDSVDFCIYKPLTLTIECEDTTYPNKAVAQILASDNDFGYDVSISIDGEYYRSASLASGEALVDLEGLNVGTHQVTVTFESCYCGTYVSCSASTQFTVFPHE
ncbi:MAG: Ig-like domain-containing protein [Bacteroidaceae bacterium]|nr:Ig-like domain-containing protein [Bacteroidaceae bacterium]